VLAIRPNRYILAAAFATLILSGLAIARASASVMKELSITEQWHNMDCGPQGNLEFQAIKIAPAGTIRVPAPADVPLNTELNDQIG
jgi:hypothetical protein